MANFQRFRLAQLTPKRVTDAVARRAADVPSALAWRFSPQAATNRAKIAAMAGTQKGKTCVIVCNGPSIQHTNMTQLKDHFTITMNRAYLSFEDWGFTSDLHVSINSLVVEQFAKDLSQLPMPFLTSYNYRHLFQDCSHTSFLRIPNSVGDTFETDLTRPIRAGGTVTFTALHIAYYLGFQRAIIVGMDHRFSAQGTPNATKDRTEEADKDHYRADYFPKGIKWQLPDLYRSELAYDLARKAFQADGREVIDATVNGACDVFPKMSLEDALTEAPAR